MDWYINSFFLLLVVLDPIGLAPVFASITYGSSRAEIRRMAIKGTVVAGIILALFTMMGHLMLTVLHISLPAFRMAGGILLFLLALDMVFGTEPLWRRPGNPREEREWQQKNDVSVFPLAFPLIAGPGAITTVFLLLTELPSALVSRLQVLAVVAAGLFAVLLGLILAGRIAGLLGETGAHIAGRILGVIIAALAVQYVIDAIREAFTSV